VFSVSPNILSVFVVLSTVIDNNKEFMGYHSLICLNYTKSLIKEFGYAVAQLVEALRYKPEGRGFDSG
jgi:hypothetical protein